MGAFTESCVEPGESDKTYEYVRTASDVGDDGDSYQRFDRR